MSICACGCNEPAPDGKKFIRGHWSRTPAAKKVFAARRKKHVVGNLSGLCLCGCGEKTGIAKDNRPERGYYKGQNLFYRPGHEGRTRTGARAGGWRGGRNINSTGYVYIHKPEHPHCTAYGYMLEHRLVMEKKLGRYLKPHEKVHHINGNKTDNRVKNLVVITQSAHMRKHNPLKHWRKKHPDEARTQSALAGRKGAEARWGPSAPSR